MIDGLFKNMDSIFEGLHSVIEEIKRNFFIEHEELIKVIETRKAMNNNNEAWPSDHPLDSDVQMNGNSDNRHNYEHGSHHDSSYGHGNGHMDISAMDDMDDDSHSAHTGRPGQARVNVDGPNRGDARQINQGYNFDPRTGQPLTSNPPAKDRTLERISGQMAGLSEKIDMLSSYVSRVATLVQNEAAATRAAVQNKLNQLDRQDQLEKLKSVIEDQQAIIKNQHDASVKYNEDVIYKMQKPLIMEMIGIADEIRMIMECKRQDESYDLMEALQNLEESVEASLSNNSVRRFRESEYNDVTLERRRQTVVERQDTSDPDLDGHYVSYSPGYEWTMPYLVVNSEVKLKKIIEENRVPQTFSLVIRPEEVVKLKYRPDERPEETETEATVEPTEETTESED